MANRSGAILGRLRASIRLLCLLHALGRVAVFAALLLGLVYIGDRLLDYPRGIRILQLFLLGALFLYVLFRVLIRPCFLIPLTDDDLALLIERTHPQLRERFITVLQAERHAEVAASAHPALLQHLRAETGALVGALRVARTVRLRAAGFSLLAGLVCAAALVAGAISQGENSGIFFRRLLGSATPWPRSTTLEITLLDRRGEVLARGLSDGEITLEIPRSNSLRVEVHASGEVPPQARLLTAGGRIDEISRQGQKKARTEAHFVYTYREITRDFEFWVQAGDDRDRKPLVHVRTYPPPRVRAIWAHIQAPEYLPPLLSKQGSRVVPHGNLVALEGSQADITILVEGEVSGARVLCEPAPAPAWRSRELERLAQPPRPPAVLAADLPAGELSAFRLRDLPISGDRPFHYQLLFEDRLGRSPERPNAYLVTPIPDETPTVELRLAGAPEFLVSPAGALLATLQVTDEYDVASVDLGVYEDVFSRGQQAPARRWSQILLDPARSGEDLGARRSSQGRTVYLLWRITDLAEIAAAGVPIQPGTSLLVDATARDRRPGSQPSISPTAAVSVTDPSEFLRRLVEVLKEMRAEAMDLRLEERDFLAVLREVRAALRESSASQSWSREDTSFDRHETTSRARQLGARFATVVQGVILNRIGVEIASEPNLQRTSPGVSAAASSPELKALKRILEERMTARSPDAPRSGSELDLDVLAALCSNPREVSSQKPLLALLEIGARFSRLIAELYPRVGDLTDQLASAEEAAALGAPLDELIASQEQLVALLDEICDGLVRWDSFESILWDFRKTLDDLVRFRRDI